MNMKTFVFGVALSALTTSSALTLRERSSGNAEALNVVQFDFERREVSGPSALQRRQNVGVSLPAAPVHITSSYCHHFTNTYPVFSPLCDQCHDGDSTAKFWPQP